MENTEERQHTPVRLPMYNGYTVDFRLREFRSVEHDDIEFVPFRSELGERLLSEMLAKRLVPDDVITTLS
jgi:hypothetical protein